MCTSPRRLLNFFPRPKESHRDQMTSGDLRSFIERPIARAIQKVAVHRRMCTHPQNTARNPKHLKLIKPQPTNVRLGLPHVLEQVRPDLLVRIDTDWLSNS